jgi:histidyl-tRNA synthetase
MAEKIDSNPARGMRDVLPDEVVVRDRAMDTILRVYRRHGFVRIETPAVESLRLLLGSEGGENEKLVYKILKRGDKLEAASGSEDLADLGLRFDLTVPLARYYAQHHAKLPQPLKAIQIGPVWRAERPQRGRYRQFTQCDIDILGMSSEVAEIELILATAEALSELGLTGLTVRINDRRVLTAIAARCGFEPARFDSVFIALDKLDKIGEAGVAKELADAGHPAPAVEALRRLLAASTGDAARLDELRRELGPTLDAGVWEALSRIITAVRQDAEGRLPGFAIAFDPTLVRGMGYYTGPIFEIAQASAPWSIAGGGRYDRMIGRFLGRDVPATGFSIGFERVVGLLMERGAAEGGERRVALVFAEETADLAGVLRMARELREKGDAVTLAVRARKLGPQLQALEGQGFTRIGVVGDDGAVEWRGREARA